MNITAIENKKSNMKKILQYIFDCGSTTRVDISRNFDLSTSTVTNCINELIKMDLVVPGDKITGTVGRKPTSLTVNGKNKYFIIVSTQLEFLYLTTLDLNGNIICETQKSHFYNNHADSGDFALKSFTSTIVDYVENLSEEIRSNIKYMAISIMGIVSRDDKVYASYYQWYNIPILANLKHHYSFPIYCENITRQKAWPDLKIIESDFKNIVYLYIGIGVGCVQFFDGKIIEGRNRSSGEIGHICLDPNGDVCSCGNRGCAERFLGEKHILQEASTFLEGSNKCETLCHLVNDLYMPLSLETLLTAEELGSIKVHGLLLRTAQYIGRLLAFIFNVMDPDCVIVSGKIIENSDFIYSQALREMNTHIINVAEREINIKKSNFKEEDFLNAVFHYSIKDYVKSLKF